MTAARHAVGILAYGSLIDEPGDEISAVTVAMKSNVTTPFNVEFARKSRKRENAPTLVPVTGYGAPVRAKVFVVDVAEAEASNRIYRREINAVGSGRRYVPPKTIGPDTVVVARLKDFADVATVLYTEIAANIEKPDADKLASLAIASARAIRDGRDGITYLMRAKANGIETPLSAAYESEILRKLKVRDLDEALREARNEPI